MQKSLIIVIVAIIAVVGIAAGIYFFAPQIFNQQPTTNQSTSNQSNISLITNNSNISSTTQKQNVTTTYNNTPVTEKNQTQLPESNLTYTGFYEELKDIKLPEVGVMSIILNANSTGTNTSNPGKATMKVLLYFDNISKLYYGNLSLEMTSTEGYYNNYNMTIEFVGKDNVSIFCYPIMGTTYCYKTEVNTTTNMWQIFKVNESQLTEEIKELLNKIPFNKTTENGKEIYTVEINNELINNIIVEISNIKSLKDVSSLYFTGKYINETLQGLNQIQINGRLTIETYNNELNSIGLTLQLINNTDPTQKVNIDVYIEIKELSQEEVASIVNKKFEELSSIAVEMNWTTSNAMI